MLERGAGYLTDEARVEDRIGGGHAEGLFEAWSNLYARFAVAMAEADKGALRRLLVSGCQSRRTGHQVDRKVRGIRRQGFRVGGLRIIPSTAYPQESSDSISFLF